MKLYVENKPFITLVKPNKETLVKQGKNQIHIATR